MNQVSNWLSLIFRKLTAYTADLNPATRSMPEADKWTLSKFILKNIVPITGVNPYPLDELMLMCSTMAYFKPDMVLEWGTHTGKSARIFFEAAAYLNLETKIHSIDLPPEEEHVENIHDASQRGMFVRGLPVTLHLGDGLTSSCQIFKNENPRLALFFIDGDHSYTTVRDELNGIKVTASHAVLLAHDTFLQGTESGYNCGPYEAISEFTKKYQLPLQSTILGLPGMSLTYW